MIMVQSRDRCTKNLNLLSSFDPIRKKSYRKKPDPVRSDWRISMDHIFFLKIKSDPIGKKLGFKLNPDLDPFPVKARPEPPELLPFSEQELVYTTTFPLCRKLGIFNNRFSWRINHRVTCELLPLSEQELVDCDISFESSGGLEIDYSRRFFTDRWLHSSNVRDHDPCNIEKSPKPPELLFLDDTPFSFRVLKVVRL